MTQSGHCELHRGNQSGNSLPSQVENGRLSVANAIWVYWLVFLALIGAMIYVWSSLSAESIERCSDRKLRLFLSLAGLLFGYTGFLFWHFEIVWSRLGGVYTRLDDLISLLFFLIGTRFLVSAQISSRKRLIRDSRSLIAPLKEINLNGKTKPDISPADRVNSIRRDKRRSS